MDAASSDAGLGADLDLRALLTPLELERFFNDYWQKAALYVERRSPDHFAGLFSLPLLEDLLNWQRFRPGHLQLFKSQDLSHGHPVGLSAVGLIDLPRLHAEFQSGATLLLYNLHEHSPAVARCCRVFERELWSPVEVTGVYTSRARPSSAPHYDPHDVFIVHLAGRKTWRVYDAHVTWPLRRHPVRYEDQIKQISLGTPHLEVELRPGDLLYVPRGLVHAIQVEESPALHLSLAVAPHTWTDLLGALLTAASAQHTPLREALPRDLLNGVSDDQAARKHLRTLLDWLAEHSDITAARQLLATRFLEKLRPLSEQRLQQCEAIDSIHLQTQLCQCAGAIYHLEVTDDSVTIRVPGHALRGPLTILPALNFVSTAEMFAVHELPGLTDDAKLLLARRLLKEGLLAIPPLA